jgi:hypothetical protein
MPLSRKDIEAKIVALAWQDDDFRRKFVADPKGQVEARIGTKLPESFKITVHEETDNSLHFVIPPKLTPNLAELSDEELEKVAGGSEFVIFPITMSVLGTALSVTTVATGVDDANKKAGDPSWL